MNKPISTTVTIIIIAVVAILAFIFLNKKFVKQNYAVQVNGVGITKSTVNTAIAQQLEFYKSQNQQAPNISTIQESVTNALIDNALVNQYAAKHNITVSNAEVNNRYEEAVGVFNSHNNIKGASDSAFLARINQMYGIDKSEYLASLKMGILKDKVQASVGEPLTKWLEGQRNSSRITVN